MATETATTAVVLAPEAAAGTPGRVLYDGFLAPPAQAAAALLTVSRVARSRFYVPPAMVAARIASSDPVITAGAGGLRFESFSACCGVSARFDVLRSGLDRAPTAYGTTNVDLNGPGT